MDVSMARSRRTNRCVAFAATLHSEANETNIFINPCRPNFFRSPRRQRGNGPSTYYQYVSMLCARERAKSLGRQQRGDDTSKSQQSQRSQRKPGENIKYWKSLSNNFWRLPKHVSHAVRSIHIYMYHFFRSVHFIESLSQFSPTNKYNVCAYSIVWSVGTFRNNGLRHRDLACPTAYPTTLAAGVWGLHWHLSCAAHCLDVKRPLSRYDTQRNEERTSRG